MSLNLGVLSAAVTLSDTQYVDTLDNLEQKSDSTFQNIAKAAINYLTVNSIVDLGKKAIQTFSDLEEATNKFNVVFAGFSKDAQTSVDELIKKFGQSELSAKQMLSGTGDILTGFGFDRKAALDMSILAAKLGADLASFSNYAGGAKGASEALTKAMLGETEMAKMLGIVIRQDSEQFKELARQAVTTGLDVDGSGKIIKVNTEQQAKALAALALAYQQSPNAIGDFERSQDSIANQTQILNNRLTELYSTIGKDASSAYADALQGLNSLLAGYIELDAGTRSLIQNTLLLAGAFAMLNKTGVMKIVQTTINATFAMFKYATSMGTCTMTGAGLAFQQMTLKGALMATAGAAKFATAAIAGLAAGIAIGYMLTERDKRQLQDRVDLSQQYVDSVNQEAIALKQKHEKEQDQLTRLEELSRYESLNNTEKKEAEQLIRELEKVYGNLGISIDSITGKLHINSGAWSKLGKVQREQALQATYKQLSANKRLIKDMAKASWHDITGGYAGEFKNLANSIPQIVEMQNVDAAISQLEKMRSTLSDAGNKKGVNAINDLIKQLEQQKNLENQIKDIRKSGEDAAKKAAQNRKKTIQQQSEEQRKELSRLSDIEWNIEFNSADTEKKAKLIGAKIDKIFGEYKRSGKYSSLNDFLNADDNNRSAKELKDLQEIVKLIDEEKRLTKQAADEEERKRKEREKEVKAGKNRRESAVEDYNNFLAEENSRRIEDQLKHLQNIGDTDAYDKLVQQELKKASDAANKAKGAYLTEFNRAMQNSTGGKIDDKTADRLKDLERAAAKAQQTEQRWKDRLSKPDADENPDKQQENLRKAVGSWSLAEFSRQKENSVESRIEKNTRETARILRQNKGLTY